MKKYFFIIFSILLIFTSSAFSEISSQSINLKQGFNFISFTVKPPTTPESFKSLDTAIYEIYSYSPASGSFLSTTDGTLASLANGRGYIIKSSSDKTITLSGETLTTIGNIILKPGFNILGISKTVDATQKFSDLIKANPSIKGIYKWSNASGTFIQVIKDVNNVAQSIDGIDPSFSAGQAYFINLDKECIANYDNGTLSLSNSQVFISSIDPLADITVNSGTDLTSLKLPATVSVIMSDNTKTNKTVTWDDSIPTYNASVAGTYIFTGTVSETTLKATIKVIVISSSYLTLASVKNAITTIGARWVPADTSVSKSIAAGVPPQKFLGCELSSNFSPSNNSPEFQRTNLPSRFVWTDSLRLNWKDQNGINWNTDVKNQGIYGTCVAFSVLAALELQLKIKNNSPNQEIDFSEFHYFYLGKSGQFTYGWQYISALEYLKTYGTVVENLCPYSNAPNHITSYCSNASTKKISGYKMFKGQQAIKSALVDGPVMAVIKVFDDFYSYTGGIYTHAIGEFSGYHAVLIVGYDDNYQCWYVKNSWGKGWGEDGYFRIKYGECLIEDECYNLQIDESPVMNKLLPPNNIKSFNINDESFELQWDTVNDSQGYIIYINDILYKKITSNTVKITELSPNTNYNFQISSYNQNGESDKSSSMSITTTSSLWQTENVYWYVNYGDNFNRVSGTITKPGASKIKIRFKEIKIESERDHLILDNGDKISGDYNNFMTIDFPGDKFNLYLSSDSSNHYYFIIDQILWQGSSTDISSKSGKLFSDPINNSKPTIENLDIAGNLGNIYLNFDLIDADNDKCDIKVFYSIDNGLTYINTNNLIGNFLNVAPSYGKIITWKSNLDIKSNQSQVILKLIPNDKKIDGNPIQSNSFTINNSNIISELILDKTSDSVQLNSIYDLTKLLVTVKYNNNSSKVITPNWTVVSGAGNISQNNFIPSQIGTTKLSCSYLENGISLMQNFIINTVNLPPIIAGPNWIKVETNNVFPGRHSNSLINYDNKIWVIGGYNSSWRSTNDVWYSADGKNWTQALQNAPFGDRYGHASTVFNQKMWIIGGSSYNNTSRNDVWNTNDGINWTKTTSEISSSSYNGLGYTGVQAINFNSQIWAGLSGGSLLCSSDGILWTQTNTQNSMPSFNSNIVLFNNKLWIIGSHSSKANNEIWSSNDGINWFKFASGNFPARNSHETIVNNNKLWIIGGNDNEGNQLNDVWSSTDGINWTQFLTTSIFTPRFNSSAVVFNNKIYIIGGQSLNPTNFYNDIWYLQE